MAKQPEMAFKRPTDSTVPQSSYLHARQIIGGKSAPVNYSFTERVFSEYATPADKLAAKHEVVVSLQSRILSDSKVDWNISTSNYDNMQMTGKCYKRTNVNAEVSTRSSLLVSRVVELNSCVIDAAKSHRHVPIQLSS